MAPKLVVRHSASHLLPADFGYIHGIVDRNYVGQGQLCDELKQWLKTRYSCDEVVLTESGTAALHLCLLALGQENPEKSKVLVSAYVCPEVVGAEIRAGLEPVFADTREDSLNVDMADVGRFVETKVLAILCTNIGGMPDDYGLAATYGVPIISDCAQGIGSRVDGRDLACEGVCSILSFGSTKMITVGSGGAILCRSERISRTLAKLARSELSVDEYRQDGFHITYGQHIGDLTAGLASAQLRRLDAMVDRRRLIAESYDFAIREHGKLAVVSERNLVRSNRFRYYFLADQASLWVDYLRSKGIDARGSISHAIPEYYENNKAYPRLCRMSKKVVSVPIFPAMTVEEIDMVAGTLKLGPKRN